ncbi:hypothetical protein [Corynebacterium sp.]|uniref:hypothetical protein n=1 Tax=Corynebacterium sp. TaxID=1720 RepID=UPI0026E0B6DB|nr:hypothetical protein [Corynebacterium sp.]MDO5513450.1 hypothetical protein [Corynebacterium sp.]
MQAASDLDEVRNCFHDTVALARNAPERADPSWAGHAADACRERVADEAESARKFAFELEDVADTLRTVGRRLEFAKVAAENAAVDIENDPHGLVVHDDWAVNISPMALIPTSETDPEKVRQAMIERQEQMDAAVRFLVDEDAACAQLVTEAMTRAANAGRRLDQAAAFERATGRLPETPADWLTASMLDPTSEAEKNQGVEATVVMGRIAAVPGGGVVRTELYIPVDDVFNFRLMPPDVEYDLGDSRGTSPESTVGDARVELVIDYENGVIVARQNPTVTVEGGVRVGSPSVDVQQLDNGDVRVHYEGVNPYAPGGGEPAHKVTGEIVVSVADGHPRVGGVVGAYPSLEIYHHREDGQVSPLAIEEARNRSAAGPFLDLPISRDVGDPRMLRPFKDLSSPEPAPFELGPGSPGHPGETRLGGVDDGVVIPTISPQTQGR